MIEEADEFSDNCSNGSASCGYSPSYAPSNLSQVSLHDELFEHHEDPDADGHGYEHQPIPRSVPRQVQHQTVPAHPARPSSILDESTVWVAGHFAIIKRFHQGVLS